MFLKIKPIENLLRCSICSEFYDNCVMTVCSHNFCTACMKKRLTTEDDCPICFEVVLEKDLRSNKILDKLIRFFKKMQRDNLKRQNQMNSRSHDLSNSHIPMDSEVQLLSVQRSAPRSNVHSRLIKKEVIDCSESGINEVISTNSVRNSIDIKNDLQLLIKQQRTVLKTTAELSATVKRIEAKLVSFPGYDIIEVGNVPGLEDHLETYQQSQLEPPPEEIIPDQAAIDVSLPFKMETFNQVNQMIAKDDSFRNTIMKFIMIDGGKDYREFTLNALCKLISNEVGQHYSLTGRGWSTAGDSNATLIFEKTEAYKLILDACCQLFPDAKENEIREAMSQWFRMVRNGNTEKMEFYDLLKEFILENFKDLLESQVDQIIETLKVAGVKQATHLKSIEASDLHDVLSKVESRMLIDKFKYYCENETEIERKYMYPKKSSEINRNNQDEPVNNLEEAAGDSISSNDLLSINWERLNPQLLQNLKEGIEPTPYQYRELVRVIADEILQYNVDPSSKLIRNFAEIVVRKFSILRDKFQSTTVGTGYAGLTKRLVNRIDNVKRKAPLITPKRLLSTEEDDSGGERKTQSSRRKRSYGCISWAPTIPSNETYESLDEKKKLLQKLNFSEHKNKCLSLMKETYCLQRDEINRRRKIKNLLIDWPLLFQITCMLEHFKTLTGVSIIQKIESTMNAKGDDLISFLQVKMNLSSKNELLRHFTTENNDGEVNKLLLLLFELTYYFKEDMSALIRLSKVLNPNDIGQVSSHPCLIGKGTSALRCQNFMLVIDGVVVNSDLNDPLTAIAGLFASYYVFNLDYPNHIGLTLEIFQRYILEINPQFGNKVERIKKKKYYTGVHPKISYFLKLFKVYTES